MTAKKTTQKPAKGTTAKGKTGTGWSPEERAAAKAYAQGAQGGGARRE